MTRPAATDPVVVVLTGGASRRMGSHKPTLDVAGRPLVARVLDAAVPHAALVVGPGQGVPDGVPVVMERVPGGGPVSAIAYAVAAVRANVTRVTHPDAVVVLAADLPFVTPAHVSRLLEALTSADLAVTVDTDGRTNWLCAAWRTETLTARLAELGDVGDAYGRSMRELCDGIRTVPVDDPDGVATDVDTPADLERARERAQRPLD
ncbi:molybdenum cofactor guanylyltransferase [Terrabacter terrigena]|uniref:Molybdenum cofactor guanylyltransferase n=1 Tax=Terrabacter terrigena TaxID=574718 RepID=A0ABW3N3K3_9MICO